MSLLKLPNELILLVSGLLDNVYCLNSLLQTCRRLHLLLNRVLYEYDSPYQTALKWALYSGCQATVQYALEAGASPDSFPLLHVPRYIESPMYIACSLGNEAIVRSLLDHGTSERSAIIGMRMAASGGHDHLIRLLLDHGISPKDHSPSSVFPLTMAVRFGHLSTMKLLLSLGCDAHVPGFFGPSVLFDAAFSGYNEILRFLLADANINPPLVDYMAICAAASQGHEDALDILLQYEMIPSPEQNMRFMPLVLAAQNERYAAARRLRESLDFQSIIASGWPDDDANKLLFIVSAACGWPDIIEDLIRHGCPIDIEEPILPSLGRCSHLAKSWHPQTNSARSPLVISAMRGHLKIVQLLLNHDDTLHEDTIMRAISGAILGGYGKIVEILMNSLSSPRYNPECFGESVLDKAVQSPDLLQALIDGGMFFELNHYCQLVIHALRTSSYDALEILKQKITSLGQSFSLRTIMQDTPVLSHAARGGASMIKFVLDNEYPSEEPDIQGATETLLAQADYVSLEILFERGLITDAIITSRRGLVNKVNRQGSNWDAVVATLDVLIMHGVNINGDDHSPLHRIVGRGIRSYQMNSPLRRKIFLKLLLDRGADPLVSCQSHGSPLVTAAEHGERDLLKIMLDALALRSIALDKLQSVLTHAKVRAEKRGQYHIIPVLRHFYWRRKFQYGGAPAHITGGGS